MALVWHEKARCTACSFADRFLITQAHSFGADTQNDYSQGKCRKKSSIITKLEFNK